jgi:hypothetical protein
LTSVASADVAKEPRAPNAKSDASSSFTAS